jgi:hypothetical protein
MLEDVVATVGGQGTMRRQQGGASMRVLAWRCRDVYATTAGYVSKRSDGFLQIVGQRSLNYGQSSP